MKHYFVVFSIILLAACNQQKDSFSPYTGKWNIANQDYNQGKLPDSIRQAVDMAPFLLSGLYPSSMDIYPDSLVLHSADQSLAPTTELVSSVEEEDGTFRIALQNGKKVIIQTVSEDSIVLDYNNKEVVYSLHR